MQLKCSQCGTSYEFEYKKDEPLPVNFPFCSKRCKAMDLGRWLNEEYRVSMPIPENSPTDEITQNKLSDFNEEFILQILKDRTESE